MTETKVFIVMGQSGGYEDWSTWPVKAFRDRTAANAFAEEYNGHSLRVDDELSNYHFDNERPDFDDPAFERWMADREAIKKTHPDKATHTDWDDASYSVREVELAG